MWALYKFQMRSYWKNPSAATGFIFSLLLLLVFGAIYPDSFTTSVGNVLIFTFITTGVYEFGYSIFELKNSVVLKRIGSTSITKSGMMLTFFVNFTTISIIHTAWIFGLAAIFNATGYATFDWSIVNWEAVVYGAIFAIILSLTMGWFLVSISKTLTIYSMYTTLYFFMVAFVGGLFFPEIGVEPGTEWLEYIGYIIPHTYSVGFVNDAFAGADVFNMVEGYTYFNPLSESMVTVEGWEAALNTLVPVVMSVTFFGIGVKTFKWEG